GMSRPTGVMEAIYVGRLHIDRLSELAPVVMKAASDGDAVAGALIEQMVEEIVVTANAAVRRLGLTQRDVHVVLGGGVLRAMDARLVEQIAEGIREAAVGVVEIDSAEKRGRIAEGHLDFGAWQAGKHKE